MNDTAIITLDASEVVEKYRLVKLTGDRQMAKTEPGESPVGVSRAYVPSGDPGGVVLLNKPGTTICIADGAISQNAKVYPGSDGRVTSVPTGAPIGWAVDSASAQGDHIEILPFEGSFFNSGASIIDLFDDFLGFDTGAAESLWTVTAPDSGSNTLSDGKGGVLTLQPSDGTVADNDEIYLATRNELFKFEDDKPLWFEARVKLTEANTDDANVLVGLMDAVGANSLLDDGAGPKASYSGVVVYKVDGGTAWLAEASIGATQTPITLTGASVSSGSYVKIGIMVVPTAANTADVFIYLDDVLVGSITGWSYASATDMSVVVAVKNGGANNETLDVDYVLCKQVR